MLKRNSGETLFVIALSSCAIISCQGSQKDDLSQVNGGGVAKICTTEHAAIAKNFFGDSSITCGNFRVVQITLKISSGQGIIVEEGKKIPDPYGKLCLAAHPYNDSSNDLFWGDCWSSPKNIFLEMGSNSGGKDQFYLNAFNKKFIAKKLGDQVIDRSDVDLQLTSPGILVLALPDSKNITTLEFATEGDSQKFTSYNKGIRVGGEVDSLCLYPESKIFNVDETSFGPATIDTRDLTPDQLNYGCGPNLTQETSQPNPDYPAFSYPVIYSFGIEPYANNNNTTSKGQERQ